MASGLGASQEIGSFPARRWVAGAPPRVVLIVSRIIAKSLTGADRQRGCRELFRLGARLDFFRAPFFFSAAAPLTNATPLDGLRDGGIIETGLREKEGRGDDGDGDGDEHRLLMREPNFQNETVTLRNLNWLPYDQNAPIA